MEMQEISAEGDKNEGDVEASEPAPEAKTEGTSHFY